MRLDQGIAKASPVRLVKEDILATVPAQQHVVHSAWIANVCSSCHLANRGLNTNMSR
jgi:hypothetical protein